MKITCRLCIRSSPSLHKRGCLFDDSRLFLAVLDERYQYIIYLYHLSLLGDVLLYEIDLLLFSKYGFYPVEVAPMRASPEKPVGWPVVHFCSVTATCGLGKPSPQKTGESTDKCG